MRQSAFLFGLFFFCIAFSNAQEPKLILPVSHTNKLSDMTVSKDEKYMATIDLDGVIKFWEIASGRLFQTFSHPDGGEVAITNDNRYVISASLNGKLQVWDVESGLLFKTLSKHTNALSCIKISPNGRWLVSGDQEGNIVLWDLQTWTPVYYYESGGGMVNEIQFSHQGNWFAVAVWQNVYLLDYKTATPLKILKGHTNKVHAVNISDNDKLIVTSSWDQTARLWDVASGQLQKEFSGHTESVFDVQFSPDQKNIVTAANDNSIRIWDIQSGKTIKTLTGHDDWVTKLRFSPDGKSLISISFDNTGRIWSYPSGELLHVLKAHTDDIYYIAVLEKSNKILTGSYDNDISRWDLPTGKMDFFYGLHNETITSVVISNNGHRVLTTYRDGRLKLIDVDNGAVIQNINAHSNWATSAVFNYNDSLIISAGTDKRLKLWNANSGALVDDLAGNASWISSLVKWSPDGNFLMNSSGSAVSVYNMETGYRIINTEASALFNIPEFSRSGAFFAHVNEKEIYLWRTDSGKLVHKINLDSEYPGKVFFTPDEKYLLSVDSSITVIDIVSGKKVKEFGIPGNEVNKGYWLRDNNTLVMPGEDGRLLFIDFASAKAKQIIQLDTSQFWDEYKGLSWSDIIISNDEKTVATKHSDFFCLWNMADGKFLGKYDGDEFVFLPDNERFLVSNRGALDIYNLKTRKLIYKHFIAGETDYLVMDSVGRYDGTETAKKLLYFTCGTEIIELESVKDQLWVPHLAERASKGETINSKTLNDLHLCGLTPQVENIGDNNTEYRFRIIPRKGGLGESVLMINGMEIKRYKPADLKNTGGSYELLIKKDEVNSYFIAGQENQVTLKAYTADNTISSRGLKINENKTAQSKIPPTLYGVMVGISDYKGEELDLKYAAKDATDISSAIAASAKKLLNTDGKEHVFMYNLTTGKERQQLPEKNSIKKVLEEIGKKATANDILLIFFAGHGVMEGDKKQFYFLTADASKTSASEAVNDVGISTTELTEWMKPQNIKAQKRILIFDACNSGQAIKDFVKIGTGDQDYLAARNDDNVQQIKAIDKLNEKSGLFILSASASNQSAYEMGRYSQGLLTYSLLKAIKQQPDILEEGKYLNLSRWFNAAEKTVSELSKESGARQDPQIVTNTNFNIGIVDEEVMAKIVLPQEKPLFTASNFQNSDETADGDNLELSKSINLQLNEISSRGTDSKIVYVMATNSPDAFTLSGRYDVKGNEVTIRVSIKKSNETKYRFEEKGSKDKLKELANAVVVKATEWAAAGK